MSEINDFFIQVIIGLIITDFIVGFLHWIEDTYFCYNASNPLIRYIAQDNELHHYYPRDILSYSYLENLTVVLPSAIIILMTIFIINKDFFLKYKYGMLVFFIFGSLSNIFHKFLHMRRCEKSTLLNFLQDYCILSNSDQHKDHHEQSDDNYCVILYFNNVILKYIKFWYILEQILYNLFGLKRREVKSFNTFKKIHNIFHKISKKDCPRVLTKSELEILKNHLKRIYKNYNC